MLLTVLLVFTTLLVTVTSAQRSHNLNDTYRFSMELHPNYSLFWNFDRATQNISFAVRVRTTGWVGFGLSPNGQMPQSDVVIGWVENAGTRTQFQVHTLNNWLKVYKINKLLRLLLLALCPVGSFC